MGRTIYVALLPVILVFSAGAYAAPPQVRGAPRSIELNESGIAALKAKNFKEAEEFFRRSLSADSGNTTAAFNLAGTLLASSRAAEAVSLLESYVGLYDQDPGLFARLGDAHFAAKHLPEALRAYEAAFKLAPNYPQLAARLGTVYGLLNRPLDAQAALLTAVDIDPKDARSLANLASLFLFNGQPEKAVSAAKRALQIKPSSELYVTLGSAYEAQLDTKNALIAFQRAIDLGDKRPEIAARVAALQKAAKRER